MQILADVADKGVNAADQAGLAVSMVTEGIKADMLLEKQKKWKMRRIFHVMQKSEGLGQAGDAVATWVTHLAEHTKNEFERFYAKFAKAMLVAKKYEWTHKRCVVVGTKIEAEITEKSIDVTDQAALAVSIVAEDIKADVLLEKQKKWKMRRIFHVMQKSEGLGQACDAVATWMSHIALEKKAQAKVKAQQVNSTQHPGEGGNQSSVDDDLAAAATALPQQQLEQVGALWCDLLLQLLVLQCRVLCRVIG